MNERSASSPAVAGPAAKPRVDREAVERERRQALPGGDEVGEECRRRRPVQLACQPGQDREGSDEDDLVRIELHTTRSAYSLDRRRDPGVERQSVDGPRRFPGWLVRAWRIPDQSDDCPVGGNARAPGLEIGARLRAHAVKMNDGPLRVLTHHDEDLAIVRYLDRLDRVGP